MYRILCYHMNLNYQSLKNQYVKLFQDEQKCDHVLTDVLFAFQEIYPYVNDNKVKNILEIGSGTSILLNEIGKLFPEKKFFGLDPHESGFDSYEPISKKIVKGKNLLLFRDDLGLFKPEKKFDLIFSFNVFEHIKNQNEYIDLTNSFLNKNGKSLILCPNYDFPFEPHFVIPILYNKEVTYKLFKKRIESHEKNSGEKGLWDGLNFCTKSKLKKKLKEDGYEFQFDRKIKDRILNRIDFDQSSYFKKRQSLASKVAKIFQLLYLDKIIFDYLNLPFPYMKLLIEKKN